MADERDIQVVDDPAAGRFEILVDGRLAGLTAYQRDDDVVAMPHTEIDDAFAGQGLGSILIKGALDAFRAQGASVIPECPFVRSYIERHPDYVDLVPAGRREDFGLPPG
jgi:predicted GNAT family acetyltransferase